MKKDARKQRRLDSKRHGCKCPECVECCTRDPGWFVPDEIAQTASFLKLSEVDFVKKFCQEHVFDDAIVISPAAKPGKTECIFLSRDGMCKIHDVKPFECKKVFGCEGESRHRKLREKIRKIWGK